MGGLHDQIHVQSGLAEGFKQLGCDARLIGHMGEGHHGLCWFQLCPIHGLAQFQAPMADRPPLAAGQQGSRFVTPAGAHHQGDAVVAGNFHGPWVQHGGAQAGQLKHFVAAHLVHQLGIRHLAGIGGEHPGHIGENLAGLGPKGCSQGNSRGVGAAPAQGGDFGGAGGAGAGALEAGHHHHEAVLEQAL